MSLSLQEISLDRDRPLALQQQLAQQLRLLVLGGRLHCHAKLPSSRDLARDLSIARATVVAAFNQLVDEGYLETRVGSGTRVVGVLPDELLKAARFKGTLSKKHDPAPTQLSIKKVARPFRHGVVDAENFPHELWGRMLGKIWRNPTVSLLSFHDVLGWLPLRKALADHLVEWRGIACTAEQIIITAGAMEAFELITRVIFSPGDFVWLEEPGYPTARRVFSQAHLKVFPVPVDKQGMQIDMAQKRCPLARGAFVTPARQYPTGAILSVSRRLSLLAWARSANAIIVEDDYDSEYRYAGQPLPALYSLGAEQSIVYLGSFSKVFSPLLRLGYMVVPEPLIAAFHQERLFYGSPPSLIAQPALAQFISDGHFASHIRRMRRIYASRRACLVKALQPGKDQYFTIDESPAGLLLLLRLQRGFSDKVMMAKLNDAGVETERLSPHFHGRSRQQGLLLNFAGFSEKELQQAAHKLLQVFSIEKSRQRLAQ